MTITQAVPPFKSGKGNFINAIDGEQSRFTPANNPALDKWREITIANTVSVAPATASVGDTVQISLKDWDPGVTVTSAMIAGISIPNVSATTDLNGQINFDADIPDDVPVGTHKLYVTVGDATENTNITIGGSTLIVTPASVVPNQSISVIGRGFRAGHTINQGTTAADNADGSLISIGGSSTGLGRDSSNNQIVTNNINDGKLVLVDSGGNWSSAMVVPVNSTTVQPETHQFKVQDGSGRAGVVDMVIAPRTLTIDPPVGRVGTVVTLTGSGFPANNLNSENPTPLVEIKYDGDTITTATPDASGNFVISLRVPLNAGIPSTNIVNAEFKYGTTGTLTPVLTTVAHDVVPGDIVPSVSEASPGTKVTLSGSGFKAYVSLQSMFLGGIEITPSPKPATNDTGMFETTFLVPQLTPGTHTLSATVGQVFSSAPFKIVDSSAVPMMPTMMEAEAATPDVAFAAVIAEDNLIAVYHFDPATQNEAPNYGYTIYDARPLFMSGNNLDSIEPGQFYTVTGV